MVRRAIRLIGLLPSCNEEANSRQRGRRDNRPTKSATPDGRRHTAVIVLGYGRRATGPRGPALFTESEAANDRRTATLCRRSKRRHQQLRQSIIRKRHTGSGFTPASAEWHGGRGGDRDAGWTEERNGRCASAATSSDEILPADAHRDSISPRLPKSLEDTVTVPGATATTSCTRSAIRSPAPSPDYRNDGTDDAASFAHRAGDHHDGMQYFGLGPNGKHQPHSSDRGLLCMNHEAITPAYLHPTGPTIVNGVRTVADEVLKEFYVHGVSVIEVAKQKDRKRGSWSALCFFDTPHEWDYEQRSRFNRRVHTLTPMKLSGPAARTAFMMTKFSPSGSKTRGTINNCAQGYDAVGHVSDVRRELGRLLPADRGDRRSESHREGAGFVRPLRRRRHWPRAVGDRHAGHARQSLRPLERDEARRVRRWQRRLSQRRQHVRLGRRDRSVRRRLRRRKKRTALGRFAREGAGSGR